ncbi:DUF2785 domain-containing protein [Lacticaseibacillus paracasei]|uniref:DUF2785 domain-containing protein n=1 Tax=Lacticaseibacillus paracasei TaxID=1597 RepID=UPI0031CFB7A7
MTQLDTIQRTVQQLRDLLNKGEIFTALPNMLGKVIESVAVEPATPIKIPRDDKTAIVKIRAIQKRIKQTSDPSVTDDEIDFLAAHLASTNPAVRDKGVFFLFNDLFQAEAFTNEQIQTLFKRLQAPDILFNHIFEPQNNGIFLRSFSLMILSGMIYADRNRYHVLTKADYLATVQNIAVYILLEKDGRGYVEKKGWAHAYTHIGNMLEELSQVGVLPRAEKVLLMAAVVEAWRRVERPLVFGEDHRMALYLSSLTNVNKFYSETLLMCLKNWQHALVNVRPQESYSFWVRWYNRNRLLQALALRADLPQPIADYIQQIVDLF